MDFINDFIQSTGIASIFTDDGWKSLVMIALACILLYLGIVKGFEPYLMIPIAFGMFLVNIPGSASILMNDAEGEYGLFYYLKHNMMSIIPPLIFLGVGASTDFGPLIANPKSLLLGAAAQAGIFFAFLGAILLGMTAAEAASIAIIGGADGPTAIYVATEMLDEKLSSISVGTIAVAAYSYMALVPVIQPPIIRLLTTKKERNIKMSQGRTVSKAEKVVFPLLVSLIVILLIPASAPLVGMLMFGNLIKESGVVPNLVDTAKNALMYTLTILIGLIVGATTQGYKFLTVDTLKVLALGLAAFAIGTAVGVLSGKLMNAVSKNPVNPMIGAAGVSAVPMAARVVNKCGQDEDKSNFLLMHAMGPNVAGVIGSAIAAGMLLTFIG